MPICAPIQVLKLTVMRLRACVGGSVRVTLMVGLAAFVGACTTSPTGKPSMFVGGCLADRADIVEAANWDGVQPNKITIVNGEIRPMVMYMEQGRPYVFEVRNADNKDHDLWSPDFFKRGVALESLQFGNKAPAKGCVNGVRVKARSTVVMRFVPVWEGRYLFNNSNSFIHAPTGPDAVVNIVPQRVGIASK